MNKVGCAAAIGHDREKEGCEGHHGDGRISPHTHQEKRGDSYQAHLVVLPCRFPSKHGVSFSFRRWLLFQWN